MDIRLSNVEMKYGKNVVLNNVDYTFVSPNLYIITGASGSGKTTLVSIINGSLKPTGGTVHVGGKLIKNYCSDIGVVMQNPYVFSFLSLKDNVLFASDLAKKHDKNIEMKVIDLFKRFSLDGSMEKKAKVCSGGECQRTNIIRNLILDKKILIFDEPTANLDDENSKIVQQMINELSQEFLVIVVTHDYEVFSSLKHEYIKITQGELNYESKN